MLELPSKEDGKTVSFRSQNGKNRRNLFSSWKEEKEERKKQKETIYIFSSQRRVTIFYFIARLVTDRAVTRKIHMFSSPSVAFVYSL